MGVIDMLDINKLIDNKDIDLKFPKLHFSLEVTKSYLRPLIRLDSMIGKNDVLSMWDSGASVPVWTDSLRNFKRLFPSCTYVKRTTLNGFGGDGKEVDVYKIDAFKLGQLTFLDLVILVDTDMCAPCDLILCAPMLDGLFYSFDLRKRPPDSEDFEKLIVYYDVKDAIRHVVLEEDNIRVYYNKVLADKYLQGVDEDTANIASAYHDYFNRKV